MPFRPSLEPTFGAPGVWCPADHDLPALLFAFMPELVWTDPVDKSYTCLLLSPTYVKDESMMRYGMFEYVTVGRRRVQLTFQIRLALGKSTLPTNADEEVVGPPPISPIPRHRPPFQTWPDLRGESTPDHGTHHHRPHIPSYTMTDLPGTPDATHPLSAQELEAGLIYAVLTYRGELASWNWAFFVPNPSVAPIGTSGTMFHVVETDSAGVWRFEVESRDVISSPLVVAILRLADVGFLGDYDDVVGKDSLLPMFRTVAIPAQASTEFSSRTWFLEAICVLHDCGVVQCDDVWLLEREIRRCAFTAMDKYLENKGA
ncbi:unnamed protein product [Cyclocybe aegerita]|uniref:Uncharacterized protein n=1 Tax=Cyclocybe aegerita TaxID=1973307 RepID=A0A8S0XSP1_CYCAE|nr:unnamed protein product [Cyclocybe aegerita]